MNKLLTKVAALSVGLAMAIGVGVVIGIKGNSVIRVIAVGTNAAYRTATFVSDQGSDPTSMSQNVQDYKTSWTNTNGTFEIGLTNFNNNNRDWSYVRCGSKNAASVATITTSAIIDQAITSVVVTVDATTASNLNSQKLYVASNSAFTENLQTINGSTLVVGKNYFNVTAPTTARYYKLEFDCKKSSNGFLQISKIEYHTAQTEANAYAELFIDGNGDGSVKTCANTISNWAALKTTFGKLSTSAQTILSEATHEDISTYDGSTAYTVANCVARYDDAVRKNVSLQTAANEFMGRFGEGKVNPSFASQTTIVDNNSNNNTTIIIVIASAAVILTVGGYFFIRKKKED